MFNIDALINKVYAEFHDKQKGTAQKKEQKKEQTYEDIINEVMKKNPPTAPLLTRAPPSNCKLNQKQKQTPKPERPKFDISKFRLLDDKTTNDIVKVSDLTRALKLSDNGVNDEEKYKLQNFKGTNFPMNTPVYLNGGKGAGKTYLLGSISQYVIKNGLIRRLFYIYAENVDTTISRAVPKDKMYQIPKKLSLGVIIKFLNKKTKVCACSRFLTSLQHFGGIEAFRDRTIDQFLSSDIYWDNFLDDLTKKKRFIYATELYNYAIKTIKKYDKDVIVKVGDVPFNLSNITADDFDLFIMDDIAQFADLFGTTRKNSELYKYFTITRQNQTNFYLAGQELGQLPKMYREQLGALVVLYGSNLDDLNKYRLDKSTIAFIKNKFLTLNQHEGILYNYNTREIETIKND